MAAKHLHLLLKGQISALAFFTHDDDQHTKTKRIPTDSDESVNTKVPPSRRWDFSFSSSRATSFLEPVCSMCASAAQLWG